MQRESKLGLSFMFQPKLSCYYQAIGRWKRPQTLVFYGQDIFIFQLFHCNWMNSKSKMSAKTTVLVFKNQTAAFFVAMKPWSGFKSPLTDPVEGVQRVAVRPSRAETAVAAAWWHFARPEKIRLAILKSSRQKVHPVRLQFIFICHQLSLWALWAFLTRLIITIKRVNHGNDPVSVPG